MRRLTLLLVVTIAATTLAVEPVVHVHPLTSERSDSGSCTAATTLRCALCATAAARVLFAVPELVAPAPAVTFTHVAVRAQVAPAPAFAPLPSRAPPAA